MGIQRKSEVNLLDHYRQLFAVIAVLMLMIILSHFYFKMLPGLTGEALQIEHRRLQNVLASIRSQWQLHGEPKYMNLTWVEVDAHTPKDSLVKMTNKGWPLPEQNTDEACEQLWYKLLGYQLTGWQINGEYHLKSNSCQFKSVNSIRVIYELSSGSVKILTH